jgi:hypothetical protein
MIIQLKSKETGKNIKDGIIEIEDELILQCFVAASEENIPFGDWFNKTLTKYLFKENGLKLIKEKKKKVITDKSKNDLSDYEA